MDLADAATETADAGQHDRPRDERRLRHLSDDDFRARYGCDRFTATVVANKLRYIAAHMAKLYMAQAFSPFIRDGGDMAGILSGPADLGYPMISFSETNPLFYGSIPDAVPVALEEYGRDRLRPGDVILVNDYYRVGTHLNDVCTIRPFFHDGELLGAITIKAHLADIGGSVMGGFELTKRTVYEDGLRLAPILLYAEDEPVGSTFELVRDNSRAGDVIIPDLRSQCAALARADQLMTEMIHRYGVDAYVGTVRYVCDASAEAMGDALRSLPDGVYEGEDFLDGDGLPDSPEYSVRVRITKVGDRAEFDLHGSSGPSRTSVNCTWADIKTGVSMALKFLLDPHASVTDGTMRDIDVVVPERSILNAMPPTGCQYYWEVVMTIQHAIYNALNPVLGAGAVTVGAAPIVIHSYGHRPDGREWNSTGYLLTECGPWGATRHGDGDSGQQPVIGNLMVVGGVELFELRAQVVMLASEYVPDTAGPGFNRGGAGNADDAWWRVPAEHRLNLFHARRPMAGGGVFGGESGPTSAGWLFAADTVARLDPPFIPMTLSSPVYADAVPLVACSIPSRTRSTTPGPTCSSPVGSRRTPTPSCAPSSAEGAAGETPSIGIPKGCAGTCATSTSPSRVPSATTGSSCAATCAIRRSSPSTAAPRPPSAPRGVLPGRVRRRRHPPDELSPTRRAGAPAHLLEVAEQQAGQLGGATEGGEVAGIELVGHQAQALARRPGAGVPPGRAGHGCRSPPGSARRAIDRAATGRRTAGPTARSRDAPTRRRPAARRRGGRPPPGRTRRRGRGPRRSPGPGRHRPGRPRPTTPPASRRRGDHRSHQHEQDDRHLGGNHRRRVGAHRLGDDDERRIGRIGQGREQRRGIGLEPGIVVVDREVHGHDLVSGGGQARCHQMPVPGVRAGTGDEHERGHRIA